jgi:hypothetical protein
MFFLLRVAFWLIIVLAILPSGGAQQSAQARVGAADAMVAAGAAVSDMSSFCDRQPGACVVGAQTAIVIGQRAQAGAKMVYEFFNDRVSRATDKGDKTGSVDKAKSGLGTGPKLAAAVQTVPAFPGSQTTLKDTDFDPAWQGPQSGRTQMVPLPRKAPHRKV